MSKHSKKSTRAKRLSSRPRQTRWQGGIARLKLTSVLVAAAILAIAAVTVVSRQKSSVNSANGAERSAQVADKSNFVTVKVAGQDVQVDGQTGQIKPLTPEEAQKLAAGLGELVNQSTEGLEQVQHEDGSVSMDIQGRFQNVTVARVNQDGSVSQSCVDNPESAGAFFGIDSKLIREQADKSNDKHGTPKVGERTQ